MVEILKPGPGMRVYDPCVGSGGMLIQSKNYVTEHDGNPQDVRLYGQEDNGTTWALCKMNMILHGIPDAEIEHEDTLGHPRHREGGELMRFDRVITNPPFSLNYSKEGMEHPERFRFFTAEAGKKADLMFAQHMLAVLRAGGMMATVMPHGILFRGNTERSIRQFFVEEDCLEAIIGLGPNLFYGTTIPACILVMRRSGDKPPQRQGRFLFINAERDFEEGRAQNFLRPEHIEKIVRTYDDFTDVPRYSRVATLAEIRGEAFNLNIRRWVDASPDPEPQDVRAHLTGNVPLAEVFAHDALLREIGFDRFQVVSASGTPGYDAFQPDIRTRADLRLKLAEDRGIASRREALVQRILEWWSEACPQVAALSVGGRVNAVRRALMASFVEAMRPLDMFDDLKSAGIFAIWWDASLPTFKTLVTGGFPGVVESWADSVTDAVEDDEAGSRTFDPFSHKMVRRLLADYLIDLEAARNEVLRTKGDKEDFEASNEPDESDDDGAESWNYAKDLDRRLRELNASHRDALRDLNRLESAASRPRARADDLRAAAARSELASVLAERATIEDERAAYAAIVNSLRQARSAFGTLLDRFVVRVRDACDSLDAVAKERLVLDLIRLDIETVALASFEAKHREVIAAFERLWDKYGVPLPVMREEQARIDDRLAVAMGDFGYGN